MAHPMYRQIADDLRAQIETGALEPGQRLRTELELREHYAASRNTIRDAIRWLTNLGLVETRPGQGTFVVKNADPFVTTLSSGPTGSLGGGEGANYLSQVSERNREASSSPVQVEIQQASGEIAARLRISEGAEVISRHERRFIDNTPYSLQTSFYPRELADRGAMRLIYPDNIAKGTVEYLRDTLQIEQVGYQDWLTVRAPNVIEADFFGFPQDGRVAVFEIFRTAYDQNGTPVRLTVTIFAADRNQFIFNNGQVPAR
jgi:GntR family transcriptional regulator